MPQETWVLWREPKTETRDGVVVEYSRDGDGVMCNDRYRRKISGAGGTGTLRMAGYT
jgi:hypothetical protein